MTKIDAQDVEVLERYEHLLIKQHELLLVKIHAGGGQTLNKKEREELHELMDIRRKKKDLIARLRAQKEEHKFKEIQDRIDNEVMRGIRRSSIMPSI